jgi:hypothetical protein
MSHWQRKPHDEIAGGKQIYPIRAANAAKASGDRASIHSMNALATVSRF